MAEPNQGEQNQFQSENLVPALQFDSEPLEGLIGTEPPAIGDGVDPWNSRFADTDRPSVYRLICQ